MSYFKNNLGINRISNIEKIIPPLYDYKKMVSIISINDICSYKNKEFTREISDIIKNISFITKGHILGLFNSKNRQEVTYEIVKDYLHSENTEVYMNKKGIKYLKDINKKVVVLGYTTKLPELMNIADIVISKPGGLTTTEILVSNVPFIIINPIPGQEEENARFLLNNGAAVRLYNAEKATPFFENFLNNEIRITHMKAMQKEIAKPNSTRDIVEKILS